MDARRLAGMFILAGLIPGSTANLAPQVLAAGQSSWPGNSASAPTVSYDRYGQPITSTAPSISQRAQAAFNDSASAIHDGVEAGIRSANNQISQAANGVGTQLSQQTQSWSNSAVNGLRTGAEQAVNSVTTASGSSNAAASSQSGVSSPWPTSTPAATNSTTGAATSVMSANGGWSSIGTGIAAPPLLVPQSPMAHGVGTTANFGNASGSTNRSTLPVAAANDQPTMHSVLADPARSNSAASTNSASPDWINNWKNQTGTPPSIGKSGSQMASTVRESNLVPLTGSNTTADPQSVTTARQTDNWSDNWGQPGQDLPPATIGSATGRPVNSNVSSPFGNQPANQTSTLPNGHPATGPVLGGFNTPMNNPQASLPNNQMANSQSPNSQMLNGPLGVNAASTGTMGGSQMSNLGNQPRNQLNNGSEQQPWVPLIGAVLIMAFSLAANLYLGVSYLDARQKYQSLVRKTAETFRRVKVAA